MARSIVVVRTLAHGGFGRVELIKLAKGGTQVARKVFDPKPEVLGGASPEKLKKRFQREVRIQSRLSSEYFIPVLDADLDGDPPWFTMPLADRNFTEKIEADRRDRTVDPGALADILAALEELHSLGYAHRDLKPTNILYHESRWKLSDFGLVLPMGDDTATTLTSVNSGWGSRGYCSPEQAANFHNVSIATDIYAFGCILHDLVADEYDVRYPYQQVTCAGPFGPVIEKCTEVSPKKRFKNVTALRSVLMMAFVNKLPAPSETAAEWVQNLSRVEEWGPAMLKDLVRALRKMDDANDLWNVLSGLDEDKIEFLQGKDPEVWEELARLYCQWISEREFGFETCDVLVKRLEKTFSLGSIGVKASVALAAAHLGRSHNRWFVMRRLLDMCGPNLDEKVAERIAIEIVAEEVQEDFVKCAEQIYRKPEQYHPVIATVLVKPEPPPW